MSLPYSERDFDGMSPSASHPGKPGLLAKLVGLLNSVSAKATILATQSSIVVQLDPALDGKPVIATMNTTDATLLHVEAAVWDGSGGLTITGGPAAAVATADIEVSYRVDAS